MPNDKANFPPITMLPILLAAVSGALDASQEQLNNFRRAEKKPYVLDDKTVNAVIKSFTTQNKNILDQKSMCAYWREDNLNTTQRHMLNQLEEKLVEMEVINKQVIALATSCKNVTIEKVLGMEEGELAFAHLMGKLSPQNQPSSVPSSYDNDYDDESFEDEASEEDEFESDIIECDECGEPVAMVIFAPDATTPDDLKGCAKVMSASIQQMNLPTWIMGEERVIPLNDRLVDEAFIMKVHPIPEDAERLPVMIIDTLLDDLAESHCGEFDEEDDEEDEDSDNDTTEKMTTLNQVMANALLQLHTLIELETSGNQKLLQVVKLFLIGVMSTAVDLVELKQPGSGTLLYGEMEAAAKAGGLRSIVNLSVITLFDGRLFTIIDGYIGNKINRHGDSAMPVN